jgi:hypothetical protein
LTAPHPITPTSPSCPSAWQPNPADAPLIDAEKLFKQPVQPCQLTILPKLSRRSVLWRLSIESRELGTSGRTGQATMIRLTGTDCFHEHPSM